jgi:hypothetical protein
METRPFNFQNLRRAAEERRKAAAALTEQARRTHLDLAEIFEARCGLKPAAAEPSNVIQLHPETARGRPARGAAVAAAADPSATADGSRRRPARGRSGSARKLPQTG